MKSDKSKNIIIALLIIIIVILVGIVGLVLTGTLSLNTSNNNQVGEEDNNDQEEKKEEKDLFEISYKEEEYITKNNKGYIISKSTRNLPVIINSNNQETADKIVTSLTTISDKEWNGSIKDTADQVSEMDSDKDMELGVNYLFETKVVNDNRLTFKLEMSGTFGGTTWAGEWGYNYDAKTGELLTLENISTDNIKLKEIITNEVVNYIEANSITIVVDDWKNEVSKLINTTGNWYFTDNGIEVSLPKYSISTGATGIIKVEIAKNVINDYLKEEYKI
ncbi:MAG: DUF3298 domain-containing protein [Bacilli bacterium]|nr:DUF3298 domain-containing protein [Bacilli bacterium]